MTIQQITLRRNSYAFTGNIRDILDFFLAFIGLNKNDENN